ncbi:unnamed protein product [Adineta ricciae]|uniref:Neuropeptide Y n=1 Tax=Adineta ricciae TaxID=249248 RepID=A0A815NJT2_ADIRI|nr:unnamed protein product [Adineta ricciae]
MSSINNKLRCLISWLIFLSLAIQIAYAVSSFTDVPPPPKRPERFHSREELKRYLQEVHEYYAIIGRPRFGRALMKRYIDPLDTHLLYIPNRSHEYSCHSGYDPCCFQKKSEHFFSLS